MMKMKELREVLCVSSLYHDGKLPTIFVPNEIFEDIRDYVKGNSKFIASIYSFYYLITFLYRYAIYGIKEEMVYVSTLKKILGLSGSNRSIDPIIKKNGLLNIMGYTKHESNYPLSYYFDADNNDIVFSCINDKFIYDDGTEGDFYVPRENLTYYGKSIKIHYPIKAFERGFETLYGNLGTFYNITNTHGIELDTFLKCMADKELGVEGFYLYGFIKQKSDRYGGGYWNCPFDELVRQTGLKPTKLKAVLKTLKEYCMILVDSMPYVVDRPQNVSTKASGYKTNDAHWFTYHKIEIEKHKKISWKKCQEEYSYAILGADDLVESTDSLPF